MKTVQYQGDTLCEKGKQQRFCHGNAIARYWADEKEPRQRSSPSTRHHKPCRVALLSLHSKSARHRRFAWLERGIIVSYESIRRWCGKFGPRCVPKLSRCSCGCSIVVIQNTANSFFALNGIIHLRYVSRFFNQPIVEPLLVAFKVIMFCVIDDNSPKMALT